MTRYRTTIGLVLAFCVSVTGMAQEPARYPDREDLSTRIQGRSSAEVSIQFNRFPEKDDLPEFEPLDRDEFLGQIDGAVSIEGLSEKIDPFTGSLHLNAVDVVLPGNAGFDIVIQRYYSSNVVNRVDNPLLARHVASADLSGRLGDSGWQMHMGKLMNPFPGPDGQTALIMPDGSTHTLYNRQGYPGEKISQEGSLYSINGSTHIVRLTTGIVFYFDSSAEGAQYTYMGLDNGSPIPVVQATRIEDLNGNAINIEYSRFEYFPGVGQYATRIDRVSFDDSDDNRAVVFTYPEDSWLLVQIDVTDGEDVVQTWIYHYGAPEANVFQVQYPYVEARTAKSLIGVTPPEGNPWSFEYYPLYTTWDAGRWLMKTIESPRRSRISYTWAGEVFDTGAELCSEVPEFLAVQTRQTSFRTGIGDIYENEATTTYDYVDGGKENGTTTIVTTDSQTGAVLETREHVFHGWGPYSFSDTNLWKVGLAKSTSLTTMDDEGEPFETATTTNVWEQGDALSMDTRKTSPWVACGGMRQLSPVDYTRPKSVTRVVQRHDSVPDPPPPDPEPASYTTVSSNFDNWGNVGLVTEFSSDGLSRTTAITYWQDESLNLMARLVQGQDADPGGTTCQQYDSLGRVAASFTSPAIDDVSECDPVEPPAGARRVDFTYDPDGNLDAQIERNTPFDRVTTYERYRFGSPRDTIVSTGTSEDIHICRDYGPLGTISWETDGRGCDSAYRTSYEHDTLGRVESVDPPLADSTSYSYYSDWTQVTVTRGGQEFNYGFDRFGGLTDIFNSQTSHWTQITNDALGRRRQVDLLWNPEAGDTYTYDPLGRLTAVIHPDTDPTTQISFSYSGSTVTIEDEKTHSTVFAYEAFGDPSDRRLAGLVDAANHTTSYGYDSDFGQLSLVTAPIASGDRSFEYVTDSSGCDNGFLERETHPESGATGYEYDCLGSVTQRIRPGPEMTIYSHDRAGRLTDIQYPDEAGTVTIGYDGASRRTSLGSDSATSVLTYDDAGRLETVTQSIEGGPQNQTMTYLYDTLDRLETITYPLGRVVTYGWDNRNWLENLTGEEGSGVEYITNITYHSTGAPDLVTFANGVTTDHSIDERNRLDGIVTAGLMNIGIGYDDASNVHTWTDYLSPTKSRSFGYDELDRLTSATASGMWGSLGFTYDELGNRETRTLNGDLTDYVYNNGTNRLNSLTGAEVGGFEYDGLGRLIAEGRGPLIGTIFADGFESGDMSVWAPDGDGGEPVYSTTLNYIFNSADQLTRVEVDGQPIGQHSFDGDGLRVTKAASGESVFYIRGPDGNTLAEYDENGALLSEYIYAGGRQLARVEPDGEGGDILSFFHADHLGTSLVITDAEGFAIWSGDYYPFGAEFSSSGTPDRYRFTQHELDTGTGLLYAKARYYHPAIGRFISTDPVGGHIGASQNWNRYSYVQNRPTVMVDPDGELGFLATALIGGLADAGLQVLVNAVEGKSGADLWDGTGTAFVQGAAIGATGVGLAKLGARAVQAGRRIKQTQKARAAGRGGPYGHLSDHPTVSSRKPFTKGQKQKILAENQARNSGRVLDDVSGEPLVRPTKHTRGVTPPKNEAHVDHFYPRSKGGPNSFANAEVRSRAANLKKGDKIE